MYPEKEEILVWTGARLERLPQAAARQAGLYVDFLRDGPLAQLISLPRRNQERSKRNAPQRVPSAENPPGDRSRSPRPWVDSCFGPGRIPGLGRQQPLAKAVGPRAIRVTDATAGLGGDSLLLALLGYQVLAIERNPLVYDLLQDALQRLERAFQIQPAEPDGPHANVFLTGRLRLLAGDGRMVLPTLDPPPDAVYLDPMFPPKRKKSALPNKAVRLLRELVGDDPDASDLLAVARAVARQRVVVKRPTYALPLADKPAFSYTGKLVRYDVYRVGDGR